MRKGRASLTLLSTEVLRGTGSFALLEEFGGRLKHSPLTVTSCAADDEYQLSFQVDHLDMFLSHSWHAWWLFKYVCLLLYFNGQAAFFVAALVGYIFAPLIKKCARNMHVFEKIHLTEWIVSEKLLAEQDPVDMRYVSLFTGLCAFYVTLFSWHHVRRRISPHSHSVFFDKVCIHQTDSRLKALGVKSIGGVLDNCSSMVIAWDETYFERLWCTFELAAFHFRSESRDIELLPIMLGTVIAVYVAFAQCITVCRVLIVKIVFPGIDWTTFYRYSYAPVAIPLNFIFFRFCRVCARSNIVLKEQVDSFSVRDAKCFCCSNEHINPYTGETILCDREFVSRTIAHWYGQDDIDTGLGRFDQLIRSKLGAEIRDMTRGWARVPYEWAMVVAVAPMLVAADECYDGSETSEEVSTLLGYCLTTILWHTGACGWFLAMSHIYPITPPSEASTILRSIGEQIISMATALFPEVFYVGCNFVVVELDLKKRFGIYKFAPLTMFLVIFNSLLYSTWSFSTCLASHRKRAEETSQPMPRHPSLQSSTSSRPPAPPPVPPEPSRFLSTRRNLSRRQST